MRGKRESKLNKSMKDLKRWIDGINTVPPLLLKSPLADSDSNVTSVNSQTLKTPVIDRQTDR